MKPKTQITIGRRTAIIMLIWVTFVYFFYFVGTLLSGHMPQNKLRMFIFWYLYLVLYGGYITAVRRKLFKMSMLLWCLQVAYRVSKYMIYDYPYSLSLIFARLLIIFLMYQAIWGMHRERRQSLIVEPNT